MTGNVLKHDTEMRARNHFCSGKAISITYSESVFVVLVTQHAKRMRHIVVRSLPRSAIIFQIISQMAGF